MNSLSLKRVIVSALPVYRNWKLINFTLICLLCSLSNIYIEFILIASVGSQYKLSDLPQENSSWEELESIEWWDVRWVCRDFLFGRRVMSSCQERDVTSSLLYANILLVTNQNQTQNRRNPTWLGQQHASLDEDCNFRFKDWHYSRDTDTIFHLLPALGYRDLPHRQIVHMFYVFVLIK